MSNGATNDNRTQINQMSNIVQLSNFNGVLTLLMLNRDPEP